MPFRKLMSQYYCKSTRHTIPKNNLFSGWEKHFKVFVRGSFPPIFLGQHLWHSWNGGMEGRLLSPWSSVVTHNVLTPDFSTKSSRFIKHSLSCGQDFNRGDTSFRFDHPTMAFLEQSLGNSKNLCCQLRISRHDRISRFGFPFFFNIYFFLYQL